MKQQTNETGFAHIGLVIAIVAVVAAVALGGWWVWEKNQDEPNTASNSAPPEQEKELQESQTKPNLLELSNGAVQFTLPETWTHTKGSDHCRGNATVDILCLDGAVITPGVQFPTRYGNGTEYFYIGVSVFDNPLHSKPQAWIEHDFEEGSPDDDDETSGASINGYDTYYWKKIFSGDGTDVEEVFYVFTVDDKAVLIYARIYEPGKLKDGTQVGDFRQFESEIAKMVNTVTIK